MQADLYQEEKEVNERTHFFCILDTHIIPFALIYFPPHNFGKTIHLCIEIGAATIPKTEHIKYVKNYSIQMSQKASKNVTHERMTVNVNGKIVRINEWTLQLDLQ